MKLYNGELQRFCDFLLNQELDGKSSRMRSRFIKLAQERLTEIESEKMRLANKYAKKDESNNLIIEEHDGVQTIALDDSISFQNEFREALLDEFILDETNERKDMLLAIKDCVLNSTQKFKGEDAILYDRWCDVVEDINY